jgi:hypothetical protein
MSKSQPAEPAVPCPDPPRIVQITEVIREADQGMSKPILCTGEDGHRYYVKWQQTNRPSLWREWIAGHLAQALDLPIAPFNLVQVDEALLRELPFELRAIGSTPAFGSQELPGLTWYENSLTPRVDMRVQEGLLVSTGGPATPTDKSETPTYFGNLLSGVWWSSTITKLRRNFQPSELHAASCLRVGVGSATAGLDSS